MIRNAAKAGIRAQVQHVDPRRGALRTDAWARRRHLQHLRLRQGEQEPPLTEAGRITEEMSWDRITYFLKRVMPVAEEYKSGWPATRTIRGCPATRVPRVNRVLGSVDGLKRFISIVPSQYHGLNLCQGTVSEMLKNGARRSMT